MTTRTIATYTDELGRLGVCVPEWVTSYKTELDYYVNSCAMLRASRLDQRLREGTWFCEECGQQLHLRKRVDSKYCGSACANRFHSRRRKNTNTKPPRTKTIDPDKLANFARRQLGLLPINAAPKNPQTAQKPLIAPPAPPQPPRNGFSRRAHAQRAPNDTTNTTTAPHGTTQTASPAALAPRTPGPHPA